MEKEKSKLNFKYWYEKVRTYYFSIKSSKEKKSKKIIAFLVAFFFSIFLAVWASAPANFPVGDIAEIHTGDSLKAIETHLRNQNVIRSEFLFRTAVIVLGGERKIIAGDYLLDKRETSLTIAYRLVEGRFHLEPVKITIPEGWNVFKIGEYLSKKIVKFDKNKFVQLSQKSEGYLFPDTYFVSATIKPEEVISLMKENFEQKIDTISEIKTFNKPLSDVVIMASILEGEALPKDRRVVAGILWKRLSLGMPLQVDSTFMYINGKDTYNLTLDDLKIDSPYNTYKYKGLPPGPISNPGVDGLTAAASPIKTNYLYFLTEKDGTIHYAKTFEEHKANKEKYLR